MGVYIYTEATHTHMRFVCYIYHLQESGDLFGSAVKEAKEKKEEENGGEDVEEGGEDDEEDAEEEEEAAAAEGGGGGGATEVSPVSFLENHYRLPSSPDLSLSIQI